jgi:DNA-binding response OmpR family regulator
VLAPLLESLGDAVIGPEFELGRGAREGQKREGKGERKSRRVLIAEDDDEMRRLVAEALRKDGYEVLEAADAQQLLAELVRSDLWTGNRRGAIDLILTDIRMPGCSGLDIMEILREAEWQTPMILMTAFGDRETRSRAEGLGAVLLDKPFRIDVLLATVKASLG